MKVIKRGVLPSEKLYRGRCGFCDSIVEATHNELDHRSDQRDGDTHSGLCPVCEEKTIYFEGWNQ